MHKQKKVKTYIEIFKSERKVFPQGYCVTRIIPDKRKRKRKRNRKPKHKLKEWE